MKDKIMRLLSWQERLNQRKNELSAKIFHLVEEALQKSDNLIQIPNRPEYADSKEMDDEAKYYHSVQIDGINIAYKDENTGDIRFAKLGALYYDQQSGLLMMSGFGYENNEIVKMNQSIDAILEPAKLLAFLKEFYQEPS